MADFFDSIIDGISDISWGDVWNVTKAVAPVAASIYGASSSSNANQDAAAATIQATKAQADQLQLGYDERLEQQLTALENARGKLDARQTAILDILKQAQSTFASDVRGGEAAYGEAVRRAAADYIQRVPAAAASLGDLLVGNAQQIGQKLVGAAMQAGSDLRGAAGVYGGEVVDSAGRYRSDVTAAGDRTRSEILASTQPLEQYLQPYADTGREMSDQMRRIALSDPTRLTDAQRILLDDSRRDMSTRLAGSGLRGSGAGIAAAMQEEARLRASLVDENRRRSDGMMGTLNSQGFQAANTLGSAKAKAMIDAAGVGWEASKLGAGAVMAAEQAAAKAGLEAAAQAIKFGLDAQSAAASAELAAFRQSIDMQWGAAQKAGELGYTSERDIAASQNQGQRAIAQQGYTTAGRVVNSTQDYYDKAANYDISTGDAIGSAAFGKREAEARSLGPIAAVQGAADVADSQLWGQAIGQVSRMIADERNLGARPSQYGNSSVGGGNSSVGGGGSYSYSWDDQL